MQFAYNILKARPTIELSAFQLLNDMSENPYHAKPLPKKCVTRHLEGIRDSDL